MSSTWELKEKSTGELTTTVEGETWKKAQEKTFKKLAKNVNLPGFRKGHAPESLVRKQISTQHILMEAIDEVAGEALSAGVEEHNLQLVARPELGIDSIDEEKVTFKFTVTVKPEVKLGAYKGLDIKKEEVNVTDEDVNAEISRLQDRFAELVVKEEGCVENGDTAVIDFEGFKDGVAFEGGKGEAYPLVIGSGSFIPGFEEQLVGMKSEETKEINVTFPEEYHAENLAGKDAVFKVKVKEIKKRELPELDDDFASEVSEFDTMDEFRADVRKKLEEAAENKAKVETENAVIDKVIENAEFDLPDAMVETQIDNSVRDFAQRLSYQGMNLDMYMQYTGMTMDALRAQFAEQAKKQLSGSLVLEAIQKAEGIEAGPEEVELELVDMSKKYNMELDKLKELLGDAEKESIKKDLEIQKTITMIVNNAQVK